MAAALAITREEIDAPLEVVAATGYPARWLATAPPIRLAEGGPLQREDASEGWLAPVSGLKRGGWIARLPLTSGHEPIGILLLVAPKAGPLRDRRVLRSVARQVAAALDHAALYEAAYARERDLVDQDARRREFLAAISHEIWTPLTSIQAFAELLEMDRTNAADDTAMQLVGSLRGGVDCLRMLVTDPINLGRSGTLEYPMHPADVDLSELVERSVGLMRPAFLLRRQELALDPARGHAARPGGQAAAGAGRPQPPRQRQPPRPGRDHDHPQHACLRARPCGLRGGRPGRRRPFGVPRAHL